MLHCFLVDKKKLHHAWRFVRPIKTGYLLAAFAVVALIAVFALRANNLQMLELRAAVYQADEENGDVEGALRELREWVHGHMNTNLAGDTNVRPPIQLKYRYERLVAAEKAKVAAVNESIYTDAQRVCEAQNPTGFSGGSRVPCIEEYVSRHGAKEQPVADSLYKFDFVSPLWSPDLAGWSIVLSGVLLALTILRLAVGRWAKRHL